MKKGERLSARQKNVLRTLLRKPGPFVMKSLFAQYGVSDKSMRNDLNAIENWLVFQQAGLHRQNGRVTVVATDEQLQALWEKLAEDYSPTEFFSRRERVSFLVDRLLFAGDSVTSVILCDEMGISKPTLLRDLEAVSAALRELHLNLESRKGLGYWVSGPEPVLRDALLTHLFTRLMDNNISNTMSLLLAADSGASGISDIPLRLFFSAIDLAPMGEVLDRLFSEMSIDGDEFCLLVTLTVITSRLLGGHSMEQGGFQHDKQQLPVIWRTFELLSEHYGVPYNHCEYYYLLEKFYQYNIYLPAGYLAEDEPIIRRVIPLMIKELEPRCGVDQSLETELCQYLSLVVRRHKADIFFYNPLYVRIKSSYADTYMAAEALAPLVKQELGITMTRDEIGNLALIIAAHETDAPIYYKASIVCDKGSAISNALCRRLRDNIPGLIITEVISPLAYMRRASFEDIDLIISTTPLTYREKPVFCVNPVMDYGDIQTIRRYTSGQETVSISSASGPLQLQINRFINYLYNGSYGGEGTRELADRIEQYFKENNYPQVISENASVKEAFSRSIATVLSMLSEFVYQVEKYGYSISSDALLGLATHLCLNMTLWENTGIHSEKEFTGLQGEDPRLVSAAEMLLNRISDILGYPLPKSEAIAILQYCKA